MNEMSKQDALVLALKLSITAPSESKAQACVEMAEQIAAGLSEFKVASAKREAVAQARSFTQAD